MVGGLEAFIGLRLKLQPLGETWRWGDLRSHRVSHVRVEPESLRLPAVSVPTGGPHLRSRADLNTVKSAPTLCSQLRAEISTSPVHHSSHLPCGGKTFDHGRQSNTEPLRRNTTIYHLRHHSGASCSTAAGEPVPTFFLGEGWRIW